MSKTLKLLLLIGMAVLVLGGVLIGGFQYWLKTNQSRFVELRERANREARVTQRIRWILSSLISNVGIGLYGGIKLLRGLRG